MPWVRFTADFDFTPAKERRVTIGYLAGMRMLVTTECFTRAKAKGRAVRIATPRREQANQVRGESADGLDPS
ncbi:MAG: hypothetical protein JWP92_3733 [Caulobacter sp.]|nr:hypothetical protein [Caulobacter sp.]